MIVALAAIALYLAAAIVLGTSLNQQERNGNRSWLPLAVLAMVFHGELHAEAWRIANGPDMHFFAALSLAALGMAALTTLMGTLGRMAALGVIVFPLSAMFALLYRLTGNAHPMALGWQLQLHAWSALLSYATLAIAALLAILLWVQERALRRRKFHRWLRILPPLTELETVLFRTIALGFALLSGALLSGALFVQDMFGQQLAHKTVLSLLSWLVFGVLLFGRWRWGWRGNKAVRLTLVAMALLVLAFFGSQFVYDVILKQH
ncbi:inner membrane protein YpjD [Lysobacter pythonis]|uniref:Inner membrane protein YpjD n=1 Tax=Solilutibacter pythonis TaxID=2483112 RepID=A0A3M2I216_9GAMM|nr:cytochrome c biogenesis protein CcsA [Lysobacter pythonis]RMH94445.1 inner membrane protein YpjD [Lysobacter pythonis]